MVLTGFRDFEEFLLFAQDESGDVQGTWNPLNTSKSTTTNCSGIDNVSACMCVSAAKAMIDSKMSLDKYYTTAGNI